MPKLNNGHLEQAITVNLGNSDIFGRWGERKNKENFSKIKFNSSKKNNWIVGDTYVEPTYCPHTYSRATNKNSQILSYTAKSPLEKLIRNLNSCSEENYKNFLKKIDFNKIRSSVLNLYLNNKGISLKYLSKSINHKVKSLNQIINNKNILDKTCKLLKIEARLFYKKNSNQKTKLERLIFLLKKVLKL